jgi:hypothetical protein
MYLLYGPNKQTYCVQDNAMHSIFCRVKSRKELHLTRFNCFTGEGKEERKEEEEEEEGRIR